ncbi:hypothetical protein SVAN01_06259 [Stagonosporopsis vannaccii]|nr:hypothetical protein SVAN01_06259 [Stagonosporopsis vannaccii]
MLDFSLVALALLCLSALAMLPALSAKSQSIASWRQCLAASFLALLALRIYTTASPTSGPPPFTTPLDPSACPSHDLPNPIAHLHPTNATGTLNGTVALLPIPLSLARTLIPAQYRILTAAYRALLPALPADTYPAVLQAVHDHDVQAYGHRIPDFTRAGVEFPFVDVLGDGTSFKWAPALLLTAGHDVAINGARDYGTRTLPARFEPPCDAYRGVAPGTTALDARSDDGTAYVETRFGLMHGAGHAGLAFFRNVTNQPTFADGRSCDNMIRLFNTSVTTGIERVKGTVRASMYPFEGDEVWEGVEGIRLDSAFIENNYLPCEGFSGYGEA